MNFATGKLFISNKYLFPELVDIDFSFRNSHFVDHQTAKNKFLFSATGFLVTINNNPFFPAGISNNNLFL